MVHIIRIVKSQDFISSSLCLLFFSLHIMTESIEPIFPAFPWFD